MFLVTSNIKLGVRFAKRILSGGMFPPGLDPPKYQLKGVPPL